MRWPAPSGWLKCLSTGSQFEPCQRLISHSPCLAPAIACRSVELSNIKLRRSEKKVRQHSVLCSHHALRLPSCRCLKKHE